MDITVFRIFIFILGCLFGYLLMLLGEAILKHRRRAPVTAAVLDDTLSKLDNAILGLIAADDEKKGRREDPQWMQNLEDYESRIEQPQPYHAVNLADGWAVVYVNDQGKEVIEASCEDEWDARAQAACRNIETMPQNEDLIDARIYIPRRKDLT